MAADKILYVWTFIDPSNLYSWLIFNVINKKDWFILLLSQYAVKLCNKVASISSQANNNLNFLNNIFLTKLIVNTLNWLILFDELNFKTRNKLFHLLYISDSGTGLSILIQANYGNILKLCISHKTYI